MDGWLVLVGLTAVGMGVYLTVALLAPERFE